MLGWLFKREDPAVRGARHGREFVARKPCKAEVLRCWSSACIDEMFAADGGAYARAWKQEVEPVWRKAQKA